MGSNSKSAAAAVAVAERCRSILASNWKARLNTVKVDARGSKEDIYSSKVQYMFRKGKPYLWIQQQEMHNMNAIIDERASFSVSSVVPGSLMKLLKSIGKFPARVALAGDIRPLKDDKVHTIMDSLKDSIQLEIKTARKASFAVSSILSSASIDCRSRSESLQEIIERDDYVVYRFDVRSCTLIDGGGTCHEVDVEGVESPKSDQLSPFTEKLIDGINQSSSRRRALMIFCFEYHNAAARDALMLSLDRNGFDVLAKVPTSGGIDRQYQWKEFRFDFKEAVRDAESFCRLLVELEDEALKSVKSYTGLG